MKSLFDDNHRSSLISRLDRITPDSPKNFGVMTPEQMFCHMSDHLCVALGELKGTPASGFLSTSLGKWLGINVIPWPKGKTPSPPEQLTTAPAEFEADRNQLKQRIDQFVAQTPNAKFGPHSVFGELSGELWGKLAAKHLEYHLDQFNV